MDPDQQSAPPNGLGKKVVRGTAWSLVETAGGQGISLLVFVVLTRLLAPEAFGIIAITQVFVALLAVFVEQGFAAAIIQRRTLEPAHLDTALWSSVGMSVVLCLICVVASPAIAVAYGMPELGPVLRWLVLTCIVNAFRAVPNALLQREMAFKALAQRTLISHAAGGVAGVAFALSGAGVWSLVAQAHASALVGVLMLWRAVTWRPSFQLSWRHYREVMGFGINVAGVNLLNFVNRRAEPLIIGLFLGAAPLGIYVVGSRIVRVLVELFTTTVNRVAFATFARLQDRVDEIRDGYYRAAQIVSAAAIPGFIGLAIASSDVVIGAFGIKWAESAPIFRVLALGGLVQSMTRLNQSVFLAMGRPRLRFVMAVLNSVTNVLAMLFVMVVLNGTIYDVALATTIRVLVLLPFPALLVRRLIHVEPGEYLRRIWPPILGTMVMTTVMLAADAVLTTVPAGLLRATFLMSAGALAYWMTIRTIAPSMISELAAVRDLLSKRKKVAA